MLNCLLLRGIELENCCDLDQVREAEAAQTEERKAHNAALSAVGAEVSRLKRGQAELAVTHWKMQVGYSFGYLAKR